MSPKVSATYRIKLQIYLSLNLAFEKAGANRPISTTRNPGLHRRQSSKSWEQRRQSPNKSPGLRGPIRSGWCWRPVPISWISLRAGSRLARSRDNGGGGSKGDRRFAGRLGAGAGGLGRARHVDRHRRDPAARRGNQKRRRLSARFDREGEGRGVFARSRADGAVAREGGKGGARTQEGGVMGRGVLRRDLRRSFRSKRLGAKQPELFGAVEQAFDGGRGPAGSAARRALIHRL